MLFKVDAPWRQGAAFLCLSGFTDNRSNAHLLDKMMTSKFPLVVVLIELAEQLATENVGLSLRWVPRLQNSEADALTNEVFHEFDMSRRIAVEVESLQFLVMNDLMRNVGALMHDISCRKGAGARPESSASAKKPKLRESDPW